MRGGADRLKTRRRTLNFAASMCDFVADRLSRRGVLPQLMRATGFTDVNRMDHTHGLISLFAAVRP